ncbi:glycerophosphodiester phosphodiesterase [Halapricum hydrolyticum]|uniref:Glycerophosphodiester phosphodiesterase family protein n=1 Tax=Halapricum hydrolyticum TaxID=2979991 RepID=A0AAE3LF57_9EURY|nr:glycerophosphodiester phosphodiesterase family protein [Halapricum hydrolyticum]MCU4718321.1 glycerophosphodiester phosphodiesterase family protein [Halapricum hydrolyticum]MCU4727231.1 glycerophosphodiester phosphodiesterase family protein [Halapricum hydrolyticum]
MRCIAHRGFAGLYPENTLTAIRQAADRADMIEVDVRQCRSGDPVVIHDETVDRVTDSTGAVADISLATLQSMDVLGTGEGVPSLEAVLRTVPDDVGLNIELKERDLVERVLELVDEFETEILLSSFDVETLAAARDTDPSVDRALLVDSSSEAAIERAASLDCAAIHPHWRLVDFALLERAHRSGLAVNVWPISDPERTVEYEKMGADGVIVDEPAACR